MGHWTLLIPFLYLTLPVSSNSTLTRQTVDVKGTITLPCKGAISKNNSSNVTWMIDENILVAQYQQGELTTGDWFKGRVNISKDDIGFGNFSLKISPVEYSDRGLYKCYMMGKQLDDIELVVHVPAMVPARLGEPATLPCYVLVDKKQKSNLDTVHWKKDGQTVLSFQSGLLSSSSGCENRCSMSVDKFKLGDLSLNISEVRHSDRGTYQCFSTEKTEKSIKPDEIILTTEVHYNTTVIQSGQSLWLQLYSSEPVRVVFQPNENSSTVPVCTVKEESTDCVPQYQDRVSIQNTALILHSVTPHDRGVYKVIDNKTNEAISSVTVLHTPDPPATAGTTWPGVLVGVLVVGVVGMLVVGVLVWVRKKCFYCTQRQQVSQRNMMELTHLQKYPEPQREMASRAPGQPVEDNEEEQLRSPVCESGVTEDKHGPHPWHDDDS